MTLRLLLVLVFLACSAAFGTPAARAQGGLALGLRVGVERYALDDVRRWQEAELAQLEALGVPATITDEFPPYLSFGAELSFPTWWDDRAGISFRYGSTGGRVAYADYSGAVTADWTVVRRSVGAFVEQRVFDSGTVASVIALHGLVDYGTVRFDVRSRLYDESDTERLPDLDALSVSAEPEVGVERLFGPVAVRVQGGFGVSFGGELRADGERIGLPGSSGAASVQWLGWRLGFTARYAL